MSARLSLLFLRFLPPGLNSILLSPGLVSGKETVFRRLHRDNKSLPFKIGSAAFNKLFHGVDTDDLFDDG